jgi:Ni/Co efflux regulator RcnB
MTMTHRIVSAAAALALGCSGLAVAQQDKDVMADRATKATNSGRLDNGPPRPGYDRQGYPTRRGQDRRGDDRRGSEQRAYEQRPYDQRGYDQRGYDARGRGAGPDHNYYRGGRLPQYYRGHEYVVDDWRGHRLQSPPRGYHWVQVGPDYVLVAIATGIIASILLSQ